jgi:membrane protein implicated in regulation of membrane protease activity
MHRTTAEIIHMLLAMSCGVAALVLLYAGVAYWVGVGLAFVSAVLFMALGIRWFHAAIDRRSRTGHQARTGHQGPRRW